MKKTDSVCPLRGALVYIANLLASIGNYLLEFHSDSGSFTVVFY